MFLQGLISHETLVAVEVILHHAPGKNTEYSLQRNYVVVHKVFALTSHLIHEGKSACLFGYCDKQENPIK